MTEKNVHKAKPHYCFHYNPYNHSGILEVVEGIKGEAYFARSKKELRKLKTALGSLAQALAQAVGDTVDPDCDGVRVMLLDLVSTDEECAEAARAARAEERAQIREMQRVAAKEVGA